MSSMLVIFVSLFILWLLLSGHFSMLLLAFGLASVIFVVVIQRKMRKIAMMKGRFRPRLWPMMKYLAWLAVQIIRANIQIALVILSPFKRVSPRMINVPAPQKSEFGQVIFANSITLTPGTVSVDTHGDNILIHALTAQSANLEALADMRRRIEKLELPA